MTKKHWIPEVMYEESNEAGLSSSIPFIPVPSAEEMPKIIFIFESRETGETEPGPNGEELPVSELDLHQYADMMVLKAGLEEEDFDKVRLVLGLEPLKSAAQKGQKITNRVMSNLKN